MSGTFRIRCQGLFAAAVLLSRLLAAIPAGAATTVPAPPPPPKAWALIDVGTGRLIDGVNYRTPLPPASLTKVITALAVGPLAPDTPVPVSDMAAAQPADKLFMKPGSVWTADEMLHSLLLSSANDAAVALAEKVGGSVAGFQPIFARTALGLGMADNPVLKDPAGLDGPDGVDGGNLVSARDLAIAARTLLTVPTLAEIVATPVYYFDGPDAVHHRLTNHNKLFLTTYAGASGLKTGYTKRAGACLIAVATRGDRTLMAVILNGANPTQSAKDMLDRGFTVTVGAEPAADQLPPVVAAAIGGALATAPTTAAPTPKIDVAVPATSPAAAHKPIASWPQAGLAALLAAVVIALVVRRIRSRRHRRIFSGTFSRPQGRDRRAA